MVPKEHKLVINGLSGDAEAHAMTAVVGAAALHKTQVWCGEEAEGRRGGGGRGGGGVPITSLKSSENDTDISNGTTENTESVRACACECVRVSSVAVEETAGGHHAQASGNNTF